MTKTTRKPARPIAPALRPLTPEDVEITVEIEAEDIPAYGNYMASGDEAFDRECADEINARLERGDIEAWCIVVVTATWTDSAGNEYSARDTLGACSLDDNYTAAVVAEEHDMAAIALDALNALLAQRVARANALAAELAL